EGATMFMVAGNSMGTNWKGRYITSLLDFYGRSRRVRANDLSETVKLVVLLGQYMQDNYQGRYYAKAQNLSPVLAAAYDEALKQVDLLVMPTLPLKATLLPQPNASREEYVARALEMLANTCPFDVTGHPAVTVPAGMSDGLPVGMMLVGRHWEDGTVLRAADAFQKIGWGPQQTSAGDLATLSGCLVGARGSGPQAPAQRPAPPAGLRQHALEADVNAPRSAGLVMS